MPDTPLPVPPSDAEIEKRLLAEAVREARAENTWHPHEEVREFLAAELARIQAKLDKIAGA